MPINQQKKRVFKNVFVSLVNGSYMMVRVWKITMKKSELGLFTVENGINSKVPAIGLYPREVKDISFNPVVGRFTTGLRVPSLWEGTGSSFVYDPLIYSGN